MCSNFHMENTVRSGMLTKHKHHTQILKEFYANKMHWPIYLSGVCAYKWCWVAYVILSKAVRDYFQSFSINELFCHTMNRSIERERAMYVNTCLTFNLINQHFDCRHLVGIHFPQLKPKHSRYDNFRSDRIWATRNSFGWLHFMGHRCGRTSFDYRSLGMLICHLRLKQMNIF